MLYRVKQFFQGLTAKIYDKDIAFIKEYLSPQEQELFFQLRKSEQRHSLNVAYGCYSEAPENTSLIKAALLHDIGKIGSNLTLINKSFVVIAKNLNLKENMTPAFLNKALYYKNHHGELGYEMLLKLGLEEKILLLVKNHHNTDFHTMEEMKILQYYDDYY
ncbi:HDIG domain-containing protein [Natronincola peptidivorans]|uniref:HDIG domain-containing protein n=1 Tax=Natronincola peptidivorans TaxID=426128 RepID=A0A1I0C9G7_9FIRM|nr:HD domain-containing protein [Natronincola peptidivorans]SET16105.1 HDIG domain-containing protein [Natronincola peptidivorans]